MSIIIKPNDFQIKLVIYENGAEIDNPIKYDFVRRYKVRTSSGLIAGSYVVSYINSVFTNCKMINNHLIATFVDHNLPFGELISDHSWKIPADTEKGYLLIGEQDSEAPAYINQELLTIQGAKGDKGDTPDMSQIEQKIVKIEGAYKILTASIEGLHTMVSNAVDKEPGKGLSTNDYTTQEKNKLADLKTSDIKHGVRPLNLWMQGVDDYQIKADDLHNDVVLDSADLREKIRIAGQIGATAQQLAVKAQDTANQGKSYAEGALEQISATNTRIDTLVGGNATSAIDNFNEIEKFLTGITDTQELTGILADLKLQDSKLNDKISINTQGIKDSNVFVTENQLNISKQEIEIIKLKNRLLDRIPTAIDLDYQQNITFRNNVLKRIAYTLTPLKAYNNVLFLGDDNAVSVTPDGMLRTNKPGVSKIHVIPTDNVSLYQTVTITVVEPTLRKLSANSLCIMGTKKALKLN